MSTHVQYVTLPGREIDYDTLRHHLDLLNNPEAFQCRLLGFLVQDFVGGNEYLAVWQDLISKKVFWAEVRGQANQDRLQLCRTEKEYHFHPVTNDNINQFCNFVLGWRPECGMYDKEDRERLVGSIRQVFNNAAAY